MLAKLAIWYLRKQKVSVIMNFEVTGGKMKQFSNHGYTYDNELYDVDYRLRNDERFDIPKGKFNIKQ